MAESEKSGAVRTEDKEAPKMLMTLKAAGLCGALQEEPPRTLHLRKSIKFKYLNNHQPKLFVLTEVSIWQMNFQTQRIRSIKP